MVVCSSGIWVGKLKFKIKNHRISTKMEFSGLKIDFIRKKTWSKFAPPKFRFIKYHRVSLLVMTILCKTKLLFVAAALIIKKLLFTFFIISLRTCVCVDSSIF